MCLCEQRTKETEDENREYVPIVNPCFTDLAVTWQLRPARCQDQVSRLLPLHL